MAASSSRKRGRPARSADTEVSSPSLLKGIDLNKQVPKRFSLGMDEHAFVASSSDEDDSDAFVNPPPKRHNVKPSQTERLPCLSRMSSMFGATSSCY